MTDDLHGVAAQREARIRWQDVDLVARTLTIPQTNNGEPLILPLPEHLVDLLATHKQTATSPYVFPGEGQPAPWSSRAPVCGGSFANRA